MSTKASNMLVEVLAEEMEVDIHGGGSTTFRREDLAKGFEPDECFYIRYAEVVRGKKQIDLAQDPPPDLVIEIDITGPSLNKFPIFAALGIPEVWRYDGARVAIFTLVDNDYVERPESVALPKVTSAILTEFIDASEQLNALSGFARCARGRGRHFDFAAGRARPLV